MALSFVRRFSRDLGRPSLGGLLFMDLLRHVRSVSRKASVVAMACFLGIASISPKSLLGSLGAGEWSETYNRPEPLLALPSGGFSWLGGRGSARPCSPQPRR